MDEDPNPRATASGAAEMGRAHQHLARAESPDSTGTTSEGHEACPRLVHFHGRAVKAAHRRAGTFLPQMMHEA